MSVNTNVSMLALTYNRLGVDKCQPKLPDVERDARASGKLLVSLSKNLSSHYKSRATKSSPNTRVKLSKKTHGILRQDL